MLFQIHARKKADFSQGVRLGAKDYVVEWMSNQACADLPESITVRECAVNGRTYLTTRINAEHDPKQELALLYQQRWKIEMAKKEIAIHLLAYNLIRGNTNVWLQS
ncbi:MAG: hypothetical protein Q8Q50_08705 [Methylobacter sp.]|nr:hypothetical protein [Methylobacter sp.]